MSEIAKAYVQIEPTFKGVQDKIAKELGAGDAGEKSGKEAGSKFGQGFASVLGTATKVIGGAVIAGATATAGVVKSATDSFAQFEQLAGGTELLFGSASDSVMKNAESAFQRVQMSTNDYLETANSFATGLKESLGGDSQAAADLADAIIVAQADVVAATGNSAENVANAFAGIMKNNFTMLDNLQLGIKPTKEGMQEVIDKMNELNGTEYEMGNLADMQSALVDYIDYVGMAGYASNEASDTIEGSLATLSASWENLLTGMGNKDADLSALINNLVTSAETVVSNMLPVMEQALTGVSTLVSELAPVIAQKLPELLQSILPMLLTSGAQVIQTLAQGLLSAIPSMMPTITELIVSLANMLIEMLPQLIEVGAQVLVQLAMGIAQALPTLIPTIVEVVLTIVQYLIENIDLLIDAAIQLMLGLTMGIIEAIPILVEKAPEIIVALLNALVRAIPKLVEAGKQIITMIANAVSTYGPQLLQKGQQLISDLKNKLIEKVKEFVNIGKNIVDGVKKGISDAWESLKNWFSEKISGLVDGVKDALGIASPSKVFASQVGKWIPAGIAEGIEDNMGVLNKTIDSLSGSVIGSSVDAMVHSNMSYDYGEMQSGSDLSAMVSLLAQFLPQIADNTGREIVLDGDAGRLFRLIQRESVRNTQLVGTGSVLSATT